MQALLGVDLGTTGVKAALFAADESDDMIVEDRHIEEALRELVFEGGELTKRLLGFGLAASGVIDTRRGRILHYDLIPAATDLPLRDMIAERVGLPCVMETPSVGSDKSANEVVRAMKLRRRGLRSRKR